MLMVSVQLQVLSLHLNRVKIRVYLLLNVKIITC